MPLTLRVFTEPQQGASYDDLLAVVREAERLGFDAFFRSDHFLSMGPGSGEPGPTESWVVLAGLARDTERIRLGTLVTSATFRLPGPLAIAVATVDAMSGGRVELGLGAGWFEDEHRAYGVPFPSTRVGERFYFQGRHYQITDSPALPRPVQRPRPPVIVGGLGTRRTPALAARYADEFNVSFAPLADFATLTAAVAAACERAERDPSSMTRSTAQVLCCGEDEEAYRRRAAAIGRQPDELRANGLAGTVTEVTDKLGTFADAGAQRVYLQVLDLSDLDHLRLVAADVLPAFR
jgi:alkanesulfonate monooxygenase SsuD/methylene tetrahydromethanopterin reductase-like flavin-dependent oxidoreductase (luciferase family)